MERDYKMMAAMIKSLTENIPYVTANLANISAVLYRNLPQINWAGFYLVEEEGLLVLGPFQGDVACIRIEKGKGVCGTAYAQDKTQVVPDVHKFPGHIACSSLTNSEIVVPFHKAGKVAGVIDIDSTAFENFTDEDAEGLEEIARIIETFI